MVVRARWTAVAGFTLVEMMVVLVLMGIMTTTAISGFRSLVQGVRVKTASQDLFSSLLLARSEAIKRNADVTITPAAAGWEAGWDVAAGGELILRQQQLKGVAMTVTPASVTFKRNGRLPTGVGVPSFQIEASSGSAIVFCVQVSLDGLPRSNRGGC